MYSVVKTVGKAKFETVIIYVFRTLWGHISDLGSRKVLVHHL